MEEPILTSPLPQKTRKPDLFDFCSAIEYILAGKKVTRVEWQGDDEYCFLGKDGFLSIHRMEKDHQWLVNDGDMLATDWKLAEGN